MAELARVVRPGGCIATYIWDIEGGGFTMEPIRAAVAQMGVPSPMFGAERTRIEAIREIWQTAGLEAIETRRIDVRPTYETFDQFWNWNTGPPNSISKAIATLSPADAETLKTRLRASLPTDAAGRISYAAHANAVKGRVR